MQSIIALLAVLVGVAFAHRMDISSDDLDKSNKDISAKEYLKKIQNSLASWCKAYDLCSKDVHDEYLIAKLPALGRNEDSSSHSQVTKRDMRTYELNRLPDTACQELTPTGSTYNWSYRLPRIALTLKVGIRLSSSLVQPRLIRITTLMVYTNRGTTLVSNMQIDKQCGRAWRLLVTRCSCKVRRGNVSIFTARSLHSSRQSHLYPLPIGNVIQTVADVIPFCVQRSRQTQLNFRLLLKKRLITVLVPTNRLSSSSFWIFSKRRRTKRAASSKLQTARIYGDLQDVNTVMSYRQRITSQQGDEISWTLNEVIVLNREDISLSRSPCTPSRHPTNHGVIHVIDQVLVHHEFLLTRTWSTSISQFIFSHETFS
uniref:Cell surface protein n=1 Tax=Paracentrotus lividus TaxID=7656 RepID=Q26049_PARLI|nr:cell surface protein [Paracentrotus lividus]